MSVCAIIPAKAFREGKTRLRSLLSDDDRFTLNRWLLSRTLTVAKDSGQFSRIIVVSRCDEVLDFACQNGVISFREREGSDLNQALDCAVLLSLNHASASLIVPADLPLLNPSDIVDLLRLASVGTGIVISPDRNLTGTNGLYLSRSFRIACRFGRNSFALHLREAEAAGYSARALISTNWSFDLDEPSDYQQFISAQGSTP